jgi:hypothetical protein
VTTTINQHGEKVTVIGSVRSGRGNERVDITIVEFIACGRPCFSLKGGSTGHPDALRFSTQMRRAKRIWEHPSNEVIWSL